jgi:hypothetical protein
VRLSKKFKSKFIEYIYIYIYGAILFLLCFCISLLSLLFPTDIICSLTQVPCLVPLPPHRKENSLCSSVIGPRFAGPPVQSQVTILTEQRQYYHILHMYTKYKRNISGLCNSNMLLLTAVHLVRERRSRDGIVSIATSYGLGDRGIGVRVPVESTQPPIQLVPGALSRR